MGGSAMGAAAGDGAGDGRVRRGRCTSRGCESIRPGGFPRRAGAATLAGMDELAAAIMKHKPGDTVTLTVVSGGKTRDAKVTLVERPNSS